MGAHHTQKYPIPWPWSFRFCPSAPFTLCVLLGTLLIPLTCESPADQTRIEACPNPILAKCTCEKSGTRWVKVNCTNTGFTDVQPLGSIPRDVEQIVFTGNNISELYPNLMGNTTTSCRNMSALTALDLSHNNIRAIHGKAFHCMRQLEILRLDNNEWEVQAYRATRTFSGLRKLKNLSLQNALAKGSVLTHLKPTFIDSFVADGDNENLLEEIHLEDNHLKFFHPDLFCGLKNLRRVYFSRNNISTPNINDQCIRKTQLTEIHLDENNITFLSTSFMSSLSNIPTLKAVDLSSNPFRCDCNFISSYRWLNDNKKSDFVTRKGDFTCKTPTEYENVIIMSEGMAEEDLKTACLSKKATADADRARKIKTSYIILGIIFAILGVLFMAVLYLNRFKIKRKLHIHIVEPIRESMLGKNMHYGYASVSV